MESRVRQNYHRDCEAAVNRVANLELHAAYVCLSMALYLERDDVALPRVAWLLRARAHQERERAEELLRLQKPPRDAWGSALELLEAALQLQRSVNQALLELHGLATAKGDPHLCDLLERRYLREQVEAIKMLGDHVTTLRHLAAGAGGPAGDPLALGEYLFDRLSLAERS